MCRQDEQQEAQLETKPATPMAMSAYPQFGYSYHPTSPTAPQSAVSPGSTGGGVSPSPGSPCCEGGRPVLADPASGQTVCSCQYEHPGPPRLALSGYPRPSVYSAHYPSTEQNPYPSIDSSAFYSPLSTPYGLKDSTGTTDMSPWAGSLQPSSGYYPYDPTLAAYGYGAGYDLAARRKNATRESTATLKAWLNEHKKNPYPTKGEKIMLAIITKMTLTQVSTWFANARRRLKKENKMTWEPRNRVDEEDNNNEESPPPRSKDENKDNLDSKDSGTASSEDGERTSGGRLEAGGGDTPGTESWSESRPDSPECLFLQPGYPRYSPPAPKPRIWSLADMAKPDSPHRRPQRAFPYPPVPPGLYSRAHSSGSVAAVVAAAAAAAASAGGFPSSSSQEQKPETRA